MKGLTDFIKALMTQGFHRRIVKIQKSLNSTDKIGFVNLYPPEKSLHSLIQAAISPFILL